MFEEILKNVRAQCPLVHAITNYITTNDCANIILACGASPTMAEEVEEVEDITTIANALVINIGNLNQRTVQAMLRAAGKANELNKPVVLDPVGAGASRYRTDTVNQMLKERKFTVIRGNSSEIKTVAQGSGSTRGVDAAEGDATTEENLAERVAFAKALSKKTGAIIAISGAIDLVADENKAYVIRNGHPMMSKVTGTGCMLTALIGAFCGANPGQPLEAAAAAVCVMGLSGELAYQKTVAQDGGTSSYRMHLIDYVSKMDSDLLNGGIKLEIR